MCFGHFVVLFHDIAVKCEPHNGVLTRGKEDRVQRAQRLRWEDGTE